MERVNLESYQLKSETKERIGATLGMTIDEFYKLSSEEQQQYLEKKNGKPMGYRSEGLHIGPTIKVVDAKFDAIIRQMNEGRQK